MITIKMFTDKADSGEFVILPTIAVMKEKKGQLGIVFMWLKWIAAIGIE